MRGMHLLTQRKTLWTACIPANDHAADAAQPHTLATGAVLDLAIPTPAPAVGLPNFTWLGAPVPFADRYKYLGVLK